MLLRLCCVTLLQVGSRGRVLDFEVDCGAVAEDHSDDAAWRNGGALNVTLARLEPGDTLIVPNKTFHVMGGIQAEGLQSVIIQIDGTLAFSDNIKQWPKINAHGHVAECILLSNIHNVTFTSAGKGTLDGKGSKWWGIPGVGYLTRVENRPRLLHINNGTTILMEHLFLKNSPYHTFVASVDGLEIRHSDIDARRRQDDGHNIIDLTAFNTDGFDVSGKNVWIHDCNVWNQDDSFCVKGSSENMLFERVNASGFGLSIGSIGGGDVVRNITFRDVYMHKTVKGIYMKFNEGADKKLATVTDVLYENVVMDEPEQYAIWIGPAQQSDSRKFWVGHPCSLLWPQMPGASCTAPALGVYANITLRNITVNNPKESPGVIYASGNSPMQNIVFENVKVNSPGDKPFGSNYFCKGVEKGVALGTTWPVPPCFKDKTSWSTFVV